MSSLFEQKAAEHTERVRQFQRQRAPQKPPQNRLRWIRVDEVGETLTIRSPLEWWYSHWDVGQKRARRCCGPSCILCAEGNPVMIRFILAVERADGTIGLLELRERHNPLLEELRGHKEGQIGAVVRVLRAWKAKNAPIQVELVDRRLVVPIELSRVVATLGLPALRSYKPS